MLLNSFQVTLVKKNIKTAALINHSVFLMMTGVMVTWTVKMAVMRLRIAVCYC